MAIVMWIGGAGRRGWLAGHEVYRPRDLAAALRALDGLVFDVIAMPAGWPVADQLAVCAALRADSVHGRTRVVAWPEVARQRPSRGMRVGGMVRSRPDARQVARGT